VFCSLKNYPHNNPQIILRELFGLFFTNRFKMSCSSSSSSDSVQWTCDRCHNTFWFPLNRLSAKKGGHISKCTRNRDSFTDLSRPATLETPLQTALPPIGYSSSFNLSFTEDYGNEEPGPSSNVDDEAPRIQPGNYAGLVDDRYLRFQESLLRGLGDVPLVAGRVQCPDGTYSKAFWEDYIQLNHIMVKGQLEGAIGDLILETFRDILVRHDKRDVPLPTQMRTVVNSVDKGLKDEFDFNLTAFRLDTDIFDKDQMSNLIDPVGAFVDPITVIAEIMLLMKESDFVWEFNPDLTGGPSCELNLATDGPSITGPDYYISNQTTGVIFKKAVAGVHRHLGKDVRLLILTTHFDGMALDLMGKKKLKPLKAQIMNVIPKYQNIP
jgi:hypothetical protein